MGGQIPKRDERVRSLTRKPNKKKPPEIALKYLRFHEKPPETLRK